MDETKSAGEFVSFYHGTACLAKMESYSLILHLVLSYYGNKHWRICYMDSSQATMNLPTNITMDLQNL
jgi:hypothetical protein